MSNRSCGGIVFIVPFIVGEDYAWQAKAAVVIIICIFASIAAIAEGMTILGNVD